MIRVALCDDEEQHIIYIQNLLDEYKSLHNELDFKIMHFCSGINLMEYIRTHDTFDLYLLDIIMPYENGIELGLKIRKIDKGGTIFYLTSSIDYAVDAFSTKASQYILKPIDKHKLFESLNIFIDDWTSEQLNYIALKTHKGMQRIALRSIMYCDLVGHCIHYHLADGSEIEGKSLRISFKEAVSNILKDSRFILTSASFVVNLSFVENISNTGIKMTDGNVLPVSRSLKNSIVNTWLDFHLKGE